jgi:hypothetical protein
MNHTVRRDYIVISPHRLYIDYVARHDYSSYGNTGSTPTTSCAAT